MPLVYVQRFSVAGGPVPLTGGTQDVSGQTLTLADPTVVEFDTSLITGPSIITLFTYGTLIGNVSYLTTDPANMAELATVGVGNVSFTDDGAGTITATLTA